MRTGWSLMVGAWLLTAAPVFAQTSPPAAPVIPGPLPSMPNLPQGELLAVPANPQIDGGGGGPPPLPLPTRDDFRFWARMDYLAYWVKSTPVPVSIVTGDPNNPTQELLNSNQGFGMFSGVRLTLGGWLDSSGNIGVELSGFALERRSTAFSASSDQNGSPVLAFPFINQTPGQVGFNQMPITQPGVYAGNVQVLSTLNLWGTEANAALRLIRQGGFEFVGLFGFRYLDLRETLDITTLTADITTSPNTVLYQNDSFDTRNQFYGAQLGGRLSYMGDRFGFDITGKLAMGATHQAIDIQGVSAQSGPSTAINGTYPGGFFSQPSNMGNYSANRFTVIPSLEMKFFVAITTQLRAFVGYDFIYWSSVVRPGNQIDRNINLSQSAVYGSGSLIGPAYPVAPFARTDFWAQGLNIGLELKF